MYVLLFLSHFLQLNYIFLYVIKVRFESSISLFLSIIQK